MVVFWGVGRLEGVGGKGEKLDDRQVVFTLLTKVQPKPDPNLLMIRKQRIDFSSLSPPQDTICG